ncbi:magnesium transporter [Congregibacter litoralis]|uniref:Magnesium transporter MgtE n=1 Tax=Congregibacter litoralis KT71 TaxID=314285 RepID=A4A5B9_9GAMM|nr:magnesium transporter [Congregibacter litoralis]EAQ98990.1 Mg2+ transporter (mgtE) [Congregibacter litoralis KT71]
MNTLQEDQKRSRDSVSRALESGTLADVRRLIRVMEPGEVAHILESSPPRYRHVLWQLLEGSQEAEVLNELGEELKLDFLQSMGPDQVAQITEELDDDDVADILQQLPEAFTQQVLDEMDEQDRSRLERVMVYDEDTAGGLMNTDTISIRADVTLDVVLRFLRRHEEIPEMTDTLIVVSRDDHYIGLLPVRTLLVSDPGCSVRELMLTKRKPLHTDMPDSEVARLFERNDWVSAPVVDGDGLVVGRITIDDVVDVIREDGDHSFMSMAGLDEDDDTFAPAIKTARRRALWLGINLLTAFIASSVINMFQGTIEKVVALAVLMPIVASMGGIAGTQTLTVLVRALAVGQINRSNARWLISREFASAALNGVLWALVVAVAAALWFDDNTLGLVIALAIVINLITAGITGAVLPLLLQRLNIDPALAGGVVLTTVTDVVGFMSFLGLATVFYA